MIINVLVIGGGMYVSGRHTDGFGTILPALFGLFEDHMVNSIGLVVTRQQSLDMLKEKVYKLSREMNLNPKVFYFINPITESEYRKIIDFYHFNVSIIAVPDNLHCVISSLLMNLGLHCMVVKPMSPTYEESLHMTKVAESNNVVAEVEFHKRLDQSNQVLHNYLKKEALGTLLYSVVEYSQPKFIPRDVFSGWSKETNIFQYLGVHYVDLLLFITGYFPKKVTAWGQKSYLASISIDTYDSIQVVIEWESPNKEVTFVSTHITSWVDPDTSSSISDQKISIVGSKGKMILDQKNRGIQAVFDNSGVKDINPYFTQEIISTEGTLKFSGYGIDNIRQFFVDIILFEEGQISLAELDIKRPTFKSCLLSSAVIEAASLSLEKSNQTIEVKDICELATVI